jgi:hypothetical protein
MDGQTEAEKRREEKNRTDTPLVHSIEDRKSLLEINSVWVQQLTARVFTLKVR